MLALIGFAGLATLVPLSRTAIAAGMGIQSVPPWASRVWVAGFLLYPLTGLAAWLVWRRIDIGVERKRAALRRWGWLLLLGSLWPAALHATQTPALAAAALAALLLVTAATLVAFRRLQRTAALLLAPYCVWLLCTAGLAFGF